MSFPTVLKAALDSYQFHKKELQMIEAKKIGFNQVQVGTQGYSAAWVALTLTAAETREAARKLLAAAEEAERLPPFNPGDRLKSGHMVVSADLAKLVKEKYPWVGPEGRLVTVDLTDGTIYTPMPQDVVKL